MSKKLNQSFGWHCGFTSGKPSQIVKKLPHPFSQ